MAIASLPGTRRLFNRLGGTQNENTDPNRFFIKNDFTDIVTDVVTDIINSFNKLTLKDLLSDLDANNFYKLFYIILEDRKNESVIYFFK